MKDERKYCVKIVYDDGVGGVRILLGLIVDADEDTITLRTAKRKIAISKNRIVSKCETTEPFKSDYSRYFADDGEVGR